MFRQGHQNLFSDIVRSKARLQVASQTEVERHVPALERDDEIPELKRDDKSHTLGKNDKNPTLGKDDKSPTLGKDYHISIGQSQRRWSKSLSIFKLGLDIKKMIKRIPQPYLWNLCSHKRVYHQPDSNPCFVQHQDQSPTGQTSPQIWVWCGCNVTFDVAELWKPKFPIIESVRVCFSQPHPQIGGHFSRTIFYFRTWSTH